MSMSTQEIKETPELSRPADPGNASVTGEERELTIESIAYRGNGVAHADGIVCFVPGTCPGETVRATVTDPRKSFWNCRVKEVLQPSADRLSEPCCRISTQDGFIHVPGCVYDHMSHEAELRCKQAQLNDFLLRQAGVTAPFEFPSPFVSPKDLGYRNKATFHSSRNARGRPVLGYYGEDNVTVVDIPRCPLSVEPINEELVNLRSNSEFWRFIGAGAEVSLRWTRRNGVIVTASHHGRMLTGKGPMLMEDTPVVGPIHVPTGGFFQMNPDVASALVESVARIVRETAPKRFVDFYCGVGVFGLTAAACGVPHVAGADTGTDVVRTAISNARHYRLDRSTQFVACDVAKIADATLNDFGGAGSMVLVDPPRAGLHPRVVQALINHPVDTFLYVSCSPDTMARDLKPLLAEGTYTLQSARIFDMFPRTAHFETLCVLKGPRA